MGTLLLTGFPGFLGSALLPRLLARRPGVRATCLVQRQHLPAAQSRLAELASSNPGLGERVDLVVGDITEPGLGLSASERSALSGVSEVWHLAAVYDLAVAEALAHRVNVVGTANVLDLCSGMPDLARLHYVSTCYVSGRHEGEFTEHDLDVGQQFLNHYEATKFRAEVEVREAMAGGLPATVYRPGIVVGDSTTGATQKYDGPYYLAQFLRRQAKVAVVPAVGPPDRVLMSLVPRDFVISAMDELSATDASLGQTYALADPNPPTIRELVDTFADYLGRRVVWLPIPLAAANVVVGRVPGVAHLLGVPAQSLAYFATPTTYSTANTTADLAGTGLTCPAFRDYADTLLDFMLTHPNIDSAAMV